MISGEATVRIGHEEVFLKESYLNILLKCLENTNDGVYHYLTWMSFTRVLFGSAEKPNRSFRWSRVAVRQLDAVM